MTLEVSVGLALALSAIFFFSRSVSPSGAVAGGLLTLLYGLAETPWPFAAFAAFVVIGTVSSSVGRRQKQALGVYQNEKGPRDWSHAFANCGLGALLIVIGRWCPAWIAPSHAALLAIASLCAVCADTCASEWGTWLGGEPRDILTLKPAAVGNDGAVTWQGTVAGLAGAALIAALVLPSADNSAAVFWRLVAAGAIGNIADSVLGATVEPHLGRHGGSFVNAGCGIAGATAMHFLLH